MIETDRQLSIKKQVIKGGGYSHKASNAYTAGIPDLFAIIPEYVPVMIEVKDLGEVGLKFNRKVNTTPLQRETMEAMNKVAGQRFNSYERGTSEHVNTVAFVAVTFKRGSKVLVSFIPWYQTQITSEEPCEILSNLHLNLNKVFHRMGVPLL